METNSLNAQQNITKQNQLKMLYVLKSAKCEFMNCQNKNRIRDDDSCFVLVVVAEWNFVDFF